MIALWHDESHINRYMLGQKDYKILSPSYAYPEDWNLPFEAKLLLLEKKKIWKDVNQREHKASPYQKRMNPRLQWALVVFDKLKEIFK